MGKNPNICCDNSEHGIDNYDVTDRVDYTGPLRYCLTYLSLPGRSNSVSGQ